MSHKIFLLLALLGPILLLAGGGLAHVWGGKKHAIAPAEAPETAHDRQ